MKTSAIADVLKANLLDLELERTEKRKIVPRHLECEATDEILDDALTTCRTLAKQRDALKEVLPHNADLYDRQFDDCVFKVAEEIQQKLELTP